MIEFDRVSRTYPGSAHPAVEEFSHRAEPGSTTVFVGPSGCGKTTLLRMVNRMVSPDTGRVLVRGEDVAGVDPVKLRRSIGYVMQHSGLLPHRTALDNVAAVAELNGVRRAQARERAGTMLELVGLAHVEDDATLCGNCGECRRLRATRYRIRGHLRWRTGRGTSGCGWRRVRSDGFHVSIPGGGGGVRSGVGRAAPVRVEPIHELLRVDSGHASYLLDRHQAGHDLAHRRVPQSLERR